MYKPTTEQATFSIGDLITTLQGLNLPPETKVFLYDDKRSTPDITTTRGVTVVNSNPEWVILD